jgi:hypothetical protein
MHTLCVEANRLCVVLRLEKLVSFIFEILGFLCGVLHGAGRISVRWGHRNFFGDVVVGRLGGFFGAVCDGNCERVRLG